jgi:hypothetical protein
MREACCWCSCANSCPVASPLVTDRLWADECALVGDSGGEDERSRFDPISPPSRERATGRAPAPGS